MITVTTFITADNTDVLASTDLTNVPADGQIDFYFASTQNDTEFTLTGPGLEPVGRSQRIEQRTNGQPSLVDSTPFSVPVSQGGHYVLAINVVTAATAGIMAIYRALDELIE